MSDSIGCQEKKVLSLLLKQTKEATDWTKSKRMGFPVTNPHSVAIEAYKLFLYSNQNHTGTHSRQNRKHTSSHALELNFIRQMGIFFGDKNVDGYINSGCTEGNILSLWIARQKFKKKNYILIKTNSSHISIDKAISLLNITNVAVVKTTERFQMDLIDLKKTIDDQITKGINKFILCLTVGYTVTGTMDNVETICALIRGYKKEGIDFFVHIDAAIGGLAYKFCSNENFDFSISEVDTIVTDFHKMGRVPYSAGVFLCRKNLQDYINRYVGYTGSHNDDTLIGSRGGAPAAACWAVWNTLGKKGFSEMFKSCLEKKQYFLKKLKNIPIKIEILDFSPINMFSLYFPTLKNAHLPKRIERKYRIIAGPLKFDSNNHCKEIYKIYIMPHLKRNAIDEFINDISRLV